MRPILNTYSPIAQDTDGICASQTPTGAGNLTINGALASGGTVTLTLAQHVSVSCAGADSGRTFTITGTDWLGYALTESIAGSSASITVGTQNFKTITQVAVDAATAGAITVGVEGSFETPWIPLNHYANPFQYTYSVDVGTATYQVESTIDDTTDPNSASIAIIESSRSTDVTGNSTVPCIAIRLNITAFTSGGVIFRVLQAGI